MNKIIFFFILLLFSFFSKSQNIILSSEILSSTDQKIITISDIWNKYVNSFIENSVQADSIHKGFWYNEKEDILKNSISSKFNIYEIGEHFTFNIRNAFDNYYEINTNLQLKLTPESTYTIIKSYKVYATEVNKEYKLINYFDVIKLDLNHFQSNYIDYYYPKSISLDETLINEAIRFIDDFKELYQILNSSKKIIYIIGNSIDECWFFLGVPYTVYRTHHKYAGYTMYPGIILSTIPNHIHELVHAILMPLYPDAPTFLHEGIAMYYGGYAKNDLKYHVENLKLYLANHQVDLFNFNELINVIEGNSIPLYVIGALIIDHILNYWGTQEILNLFTYKSTESVFEYLRINSQNIQDWLYKLIQEYEEKNV